MSTTNRSAKNRAANRLTNVYLRIYRGYAAIEGVYPVALNSDGPTVFQIEGLPQTYQQRSLRFAPFKGPGEVTLGERTYRAGNLDRESLRELFKNKKVTVRYLDGHKNERRLTGTYLESDGSNVLLKVKGGKIREVPNFLAFDYDYLPDGVSNTPSLKVTVKSASQKGLYQANISFAANGFSWDADYTLLYDEKSGLVDWEGAVHITNSSGTDFPNASISVVAGDVNVRAKAQPAGAAARSLSAQAAPAFGGAEAYQDESVASKNVRVASAESVGQVKEYQLPDRSNLEQGDDQTLDFFAAQAVPVVRENRVRSNSHWHYGNRAEAPVRVILQFKTEKGGKLGTALPGGSVSVLQRNKAGRRVETGNATLRDTALGEDIKLETGTDFDLKATRLVKDSQTAEQYHELPVEADDEQEEDLSGRMGAQVSVAQPAKKKSKLYERTTVVTKQCLFEVHNGKDEPVEVIFEEVTDQSLQLQGEHGFAQVSNGLYEQKVTVEPGKKATVSYTLVQTSKDQVQLTPAQVKELKDKIIS